ncbi:polo like kinase 5 (inactive) [Phyllostomus discolor]|uniref:Polo like kinase 5 (Inactive) n=1 Tax=Phyllostomus discolor TaxID=89673 RepID=A0A833ZLM8_9CHIR|nr:polo like kinase 5 (inactive) [Phyllostomus discolor]
MEVKIGDLGLAAKVGPGGRCHRVLCGTPNFLAPEVVSRNGHSCQSDIWALGCVTYLVLTGSPPFMAAPLSEMYENILASRYPEPTHLSPNACRLIARLLAPNPAERPSLDHLLQDDFFTQPLGRLFQKVGQLLLSQCQLPCPHTPNEASCPGEDGSDPDFMELGIEAPLSERGAPQPEVSVYLLNQGTLQSDPADLSPQGLRGAQCRRWKRPLETCSSAWTLGLQVSCSGDQVQLVLCGGGEELLLTVWERGQPHTSYTLGMLRSHGCPPAARHHLLHALRMLQSI